jgi:uncharacterized membrane protein YvlD (DUF360 family)
MGIALAGNAVGLLVAAAVLDRMHVNATSFLVAVVIFTTVLALLQPFIVAQVRRAAPPLLGGVALIATFVSLLITTIVSDGLSISGLSTWIAATVIVWIGSLLAVFILPYLGLRKYLEVKRAS